MALRYMGRSVGARSQWPLHSTEASTEPPELPDNPAAERRLLRQHTKLRVPHQTDIKTQT
jgi:hypothetical protein